MPVTRRHSTEAKGNHPERFRNGDFGVLVTANVAAHGLDIPEVIWLLRALHQRMLNPTFMVLGEQESWEDQGLHLVLPAQRRIPASPSGAKSGN